MITLVLLHVLWIGAVNIDEFIPPQHQVVRIVAEKEKIRLL